MHAGKRIAELRLAHGDSLRDAAQRTGVSHTTIARLEGGEVTTSFHKTLKKIADGYGVRLEYLLTGRDPRYDFERALDHLSLHDRNRLYLLSFRTRLHMLLGFLCAEYADEISLKQVANAAGIELDEPESLLEARALDSLDDESCRRLTTVLSRVTGIPLAWFEWGIGGRNRLDAVTPEVAADYLEPIRKAIRAGLQPEELDQAIEVLTQNAAATQHEEEKAGGR